MYLYHFFDRRTGPFQSLPQDWNDDGKFGPERYIEAHVWSEMPVARYIDEYNKKMAEKEDV
ncbi:MAG: hypothetical protein K6E26_04200 [Clostridiales bacterium]|nr:hypothetical protein [Clostridiales bacterium]